MSWIWPAGISLHSSARKKWIYNLLNDNDEEDDDDEEEEIVEIVHFKE